MSDHLGGLRLARERSSITMLTCRGLRISRVVAGFTVSIPILTISTCAGSGLALSVMSPRRFRVRPGFRSKRMVRSAGCWFGWHSLCPYAATACAKVPSLFPPAGSYSATATSAGFTTVIGGIASDGSVSHMARTCEKFSRSWCSKAIW
jgi:hypothetical protein